MLVTLQLLRLWSFPADSLKSLPLDTDLRPWSFHCLGSVFQHEKLLLSICVYNITRFVSRWAKGVVEPALGASAHLTTHFPWAPNTSVYSRANPDLGSRGDLQSIKTDERVFTNL